MESTTIFPSPPPPAPWILPRPPWQSRLLAAARAVATFVHVVVLTAPITLGIALAVLIAQLGGAR